MEHLGAERDDPAELFLCIPEADFVAAFAAIAPDGALLTSMRKARLIASLRGMFVACGRVAPSFGTVALATPPALAFSAAALALAGQAAVADAPG